MDIRAHINDVLEKNGIHDCWHVASLFEDNKDLVILEIALRICESALLGWEDLLDGPRVPDDCLPMSEGYDVHIIDDTVRIEFEYGPNHPEAEVHVIPLRIYKALLYDFYCHVRGSDFYPNGQIKFSGQYHNYLRYGLWTEFYESGVVRSTGQYVNSNKTGVWLHYYESGLAKAIEHMDDMGLKNGLWQKWHDNGQVQLQMLYVDNYQTGDSKEWYANGVLRSHWHYGERGLLRDGEHMTWHDNGYQSGRYLSRDGSILKRSDYDRNGVLKSYGL